MIYVVEDRQDVAKWKVVDEANCRNLESLGNSGNRGGGGAIVGLRHVDKPQNGYRASTTARSW